MKYISLFSGIGGFELGIQQAYEKTNFCRSNRETKTKKTKTLEQSISASGQSLSRKRNKPSSNTRQTPICVGYSEIDKYAIQIYKKHFPEHKNYGDITKINIQEIPDFDLLTGGFPCQSFSIAGKRGGFKDTRGTLFFEIARIAKVKRPRLLLLENVKGLLSHDEGNTFATIISTIDELGYDCQWQVLNSKNFGVPQNRERVFIIGHLRGTARPKVFPIGEGNKNFDKRNKKGKSQLSNTITKGYGKRNARGTHLQEITKNKSQGNRIYDPNGIATTIASQAGGQGAKTGLYAIGGLQKNAVRMKDQSPALTEAMGKGGGHTPIIIAPNKKRIDLSKIPDKPFQLKEVRTEKGKQSRKEVRIREGRDSTKRGKDDKKYIPKTDNLANCLTTGKNNIEKWTFKDMKIRRLTPTECERLQGFPDGWTEGLSDTQRYKTLGNAVTVNVIKAIVERL